MKVAIVGPYPLPGRPPAGGIEAVAKTLVPALVDTGQVDVTIVTCSTEVHRPERVMDGGALMQVMPTNLRRARATLYAKEQAAVAQAIREMAPDVVHVQGQNFYGPAGLRPGVPSVVTLHGIHYREAAISDGAGGSVERASKRLRGIMNARFERQTLARAKDIIMISPYVSEAVEHLTAASAHAVPNPIAAPFFDVVRAPVPGRALFVGSIEPRKNVLLLVKAFAAVRAAEPTAVLHLVGRALDQGYHRAVVRAIAAQGLHEAVRYLGVVSDEALVQQYAEASVLVLPSREESSPMVIQQAMAAGLPVVATRAGGIAFLVVDGETGRLVDADDQTGLARVLVDLLQDPGLLAQMAASTAERSERFRARSVAERTVTVYRKVLSGRGQVPRPA